MKLNALIFLISMSPEVEIQQADCESGGTPNRETKYGESFSG
jgi:hypothetical protein